MKISDVDFEREFVVFRDTKNTRDHYFPLTLGVAVILHRRIEYNNLPCGRDIRKALKGEQIEIAMNHADIKSDVTQGYVMVKPRLKMLRQIYLAHERGYSRQLGSMHRFRKTRSRPIRRSPSALCLRLPRKIRSFARSVHSGTALIASVIANA